MAALATRGEFLPEATETALVLPDGMTEAEWRAFGEKLGRAARASAWWIGDWINYGETKWGEKYDDAIAVTGLSYEHLKKCAAVARRFEKGDRSPNLPWTHHFRVYGLSNAEEWLARAESEEWSVRDLVERISEAPRTKIMPAKRHGEVVRAAEKMVRLFSRWQRPMTDTLTPPQARKQLTVLRKAREQLDEVIEAVEYRAATTHTFMGR